MATRVRLQRPCTSESRNREWRKEWRKWWPSSRRPVRCAPAVQNGRIPLGGGRDNELATRPRRLLEGARAAQPRRMSNPTSSDEIAASATRSTFSTTQNLREKLDAVIHSPSGAGSRSPSARTRAKFGTRPADESDRDQRGSRGATAINAPVDWWITDSTVSGLIST